MNEVCYKKVVEAMKQGQQVMIFVHSRRDTVKTANFLIDAARKENTLPFFDASENPSYSSSEKKIMRSRNSDLTQMFQYGFGVHHAGMVRPDRSAVEAAFAAGAIKVLCCTATLAWGVNLPGECTRRAMSGLPVASG
jgi:activating signal cointegrator complex subunit 3